MEYLQYPNRRRSASLALLGFKPCYKWNTFNTQRSSTFERDRRSFKPCYKWNTFNTPRTMASGAVAMVVLNLVINGIPSIL